MPSPCCAVPEPPAAGSSFLGSFARAAPAALHPVQLQPRLHLAFAPHSPPCRASDAMRCQAPRLVPVPLVRPFASPLLRPLLTSRSGSSPSPFQAQARSPQVRTRSFPAQPPDLRRPSLGHNGFAVSCPLALLDVASYPVLVHRLAVSLHASSPRSVALTQLRFALLAVASSQADFHRQDRAHAGRT